MHADALTAERNPEQIPLTLSVLAGWYAQSFNWLYLSRLAALKEFAFMKALQDNGFRVPDAIECNRHAVLMSMVPALPFTQVAGEP